jgi:hypothetical protein
VPGSITVEVFGTRCRCPGARRLGPHEPQAQGPRPSGRLRTVSSSKGCQLRLPQYTGSAGPCAASSARIASSS